MISLFILGIPKMVWTSYHGWSYQIRVENMHVNQSHPRLPLRLRSFMHHNSLSTVLWFILLHNFSFFDIQLIALSCIPLAVVCRVGEHQHRLAHRCSPCEKFVHTWSVKLKHNGDMGMGHLWLIMEHLWLNGWGIHDLMGGAFMA